MSRMRALVATADPAAPVEVAEVDHPEPGPGELVVEVEASSVNPGEVQWLGIAPRGWRPGWDFCGRVVVAGPDGGPPVGTRVIGFSGAGAWSERIAVPAARVGVLAEGCTPLQGGAIPVVGLTALRALRIGGLLAGKKVAILGAGGSIGRVAIQLAARADADVIAVTRQLAESDRLADLGAGAVASAVPEDRFDLVLDPIGGPVASAAIRRLAPGGICVIYGNSAHAPISLDGGAFFGEAPEARIHALRMDASADQDRFGADLRYLGQLVAAGELELEIGEPREWTEAGAVVAAMAKGERSRGKPVLTLVAGA